MRVLPIDELRIAKLANAADEVDAEQPRRPEWKERRAKAYRDLASACDNAAMNARINAQEVNP